MTTQVLLRPSVGFLILAGSLGFADVSSGHGGRYVGPWGAVRMMFLRPQSPGPAPDSPDPVSGILPEDQEAYAAALTGWDFWWGSNGHALLNENTRRWSQFWRGNLTDCFGLPEPPRRPSKALVLESIIALLTVLESETNTDIFPGCLMALAKIGDFPGEADSLGLRDVMTKFLSSKEQVVSETAALALGVLGDSQAKPDLTSLLRDDEDGQRLVGGAVPFRTRAFAGYGLGLLGAGTSEDKTRRTIAEELLDVLNNDRSAQPDVKVSVINALGVIPLDWPLGMPVSAVPKSPHASNRATLLLHLLHRMSPKRRGEGAKGESFRVRAQYPIAVARLLASHDDLPEELLAVRGEVIRALLALIDEDSDEYQVQVQQSACIALGMIANASGVGEEGQQNKRVLKALTHVAKDFHDRQARRFALMALGQMGSRPGRGAHRELQGEAQEVMMAALESDEGQEQAWAALALGVYGSTLNATGVGVPPRVVLAVRAGAQRVRSHRFIGSYAIALGLMFDFESQDELIGFLNTKRFTTAYARGQVAVGLGLMQATAAQEPIRACIPEESWSEDLVRAAAPALGLLGDGTAIPGLMDWLLRARGSSSRASLATAFGFIGDADSIKPLTKLLLDTGQNRYRDRARGYAAVALGLICDKAELPWNQMYSFNVNYTANVGTLANEQGTGILNIL